ncbi:unnamed protein product [Schistocephalus solidus]|uniref:ACT domain-containing protein n=1 Tax=Schistocephalus solidus TaxID=70667 RepID=A0A183T427_SCHSO|nr:unnamed protein product [Schistocephalus solidus]
MGVRMLINALGGHAAFKDGRQHAWEPFMDFQRHLFVLTWQAYPKGPYTKLEARILEKLVSGISFPEIRCQFLCDPPGSIKVALAIARREEAIHAAFTLVQESSSSAFGCHLAPAAIHGTFVDAFAMGQ